jgi:hypothetical protein
MLGLLDLYSHSHSAWTTSTWKALLSGPLAGGSTPAGAILLCSRYRQGGKYSMSCHLVIRPLMPVDLA